MKKDVRRFVREQIAALREFETYWIEQQMVEPDSESWPDEMNPGDWEEQFQIFQEEKED